MQMFESHLYTGIEINIVTSWNRSDNRQCDPHYLTIFRTKNSQSCIQCRQIHHNLSFFLNKTTNFLKSTASLHGMGGQYGMGKNVLLLFFEH